MEIHNDVYLCSSLGTLGAEACHDHLTHALCTAGVCHILYNGRWLDLRAGSLLIVRKGGLVERVEPQPRFSVRTVCVTPEFIVRSTPPNNYGMKGQLSLFLNPVMELTAEQQTRCLRNFDLLEECLRDETHRFYADKLSAAVQLMILDFFDFHARLCGETEVTTQGATLMNRFLSMLENGDFRTHREVSHYADRLCVTPKYLSEVSKAVSGYPANYWINRYTALDISRLLRDKRLTFVEISDRLGFSSPAYFSRYVQQHLGASPSEYRG